jgi:regulator of protease activity HflC (stomatin/prohibitin superfamily)
MDQFMPFWVVITLVLLVLFIKAGPFVTVEQGTVAVITMFGRYTRMLRPGLNIRIPFLEVIYRRISIQNQSIELKFQAITLDQANVNFQAMLLYSVLNHDEETVKNVAFKFIDQRSLMTALVRTVEGSVRSFVATKRQAEILQARRDIVEAVKQQLDQSLETWGYHLIDLQMNDISFDAEIMHSMAKVVASSNLKAAAENEGQALLITKTKEAEADGASIKIAAEAEKTAAQLRGQGVALFREEVARGMRHAADEMRQSNLDVSVILFSMWTDAVKHFAESGKGNVIFLDGSSEGMNRTMKEMMALSVPKLKSKNE